MYLDQTMVRYERTISLKLGFYFVVERRLPSDFGVSLLLHGGSLLPGGGFSPFVFFPSLIFNHLNHPFLLDSCHILLSTSIIFSLLSANNHLVLAVANLNPSSSANGSKLQNNQHRKRPPSEPLPPKVSKLLRYCD